MALPLDATPEAAREGLWSAVINRDWRVTRMRGIQQYPFAYVTVAVYIVASTAITFQSGARLSPTYLLMCILVSCAFLFSAPRLVWIWTTLLIAILLFFALDGFAQRAQMITHVSQPIAFDRWLLGGHLAVTWAQDTFFASSLRVIFTPVLVLAYLSLWYGPLSAAIWLWLKHPERLGRFAAAFILLECIGFLIYFLFPETPPWLASQQGYLPPLQREVVSALQTFHIGNSYASSDPAPLSAMPAMHVADPVLVGMTLFATVRRSRFGWLWLVWPFLVAIAVICFAEHYVVDVLVAVAIGTLSFVVAECLHRRRPRWIEATP